MADAPDELSAHADPTPRGRVAEAPADGGPPAPGLGVDPAREPGDNGVFQWLVQEIQSFRGEATLLHVDRIGNMSDKQVTALFHKARAVEYQHVVRGCRDILAKLDRYRANHRGSIAQLRDKLDGLKRELDRIQSIDYLEAPVGQRARTLWETTAKRLRAREDRPHGGDGRHRASLPARGSTWVTRPRPHIDRVASAWLIKRFRDPDAKFGFVDAADAARKGIPFDVLGAESGHHGQDCTFATLVKRFGIKDRRVKVIAEIVPEADLHDGKLTRNEASGVDLAIKRLAGGTEDDHELLEMAMFDGLYTVLKQKT